MCFKTKPSGVNALHGESDDPGESDLDENIFLGALTAGHCSHTNNCKGEMDSIQSHHDHTKALIEMHFTAKPYHRHTTPITCKIDTDAEMNIISMQDLEKVVTDTRKGQLGPPQCKITTYGGHNIDNLGSCQLYTHHKGCKVLSPPMLGV